MPGTIDANGVYRYAEDDPVSPLSPYMDLGQAAQSAAFNGVKSRLGALEGQTQVPVLTGRYTAAQTVVNGSVIGVGTLTAVPGFSSTGASTLWTPIVNGLRFNQKGIYTLSLQMKTVGAFSSRCFVDMTVGSEARRLSWTSTNEDTVILTATVVIINANTNVTFGAYQISGSSKAFTNIFEVTRLGAFS